MTCTCESEDEPASADGKPMSLQTLTSWFAFFTSVPPVIFLDWVCFHDVRCPSSSTKKYLLNSSFVS